MRLRGRESQHRCADGTVRGVVLALINLKYRDQEELLNWPFYDCPHCLHWMSSEIAEFAHMEYMKHKDMESIDYEDFLGEINKDVRKE